MSSKRKQAISPGAIKESKTLLGSARSQFGKSRSYLKIKWKPYKTEEGSKNCNTTDSMPDQKTVEILFVTSQLLRRTQATGKQVHRAFHKAPD